VNTSLLPRSAFVSPHNRPDDPGLKFLRDLVATALEALSHAASVPALPSEPYREQRPWLSDTPGSDEAVRQRVDEIIAHARNLAHPRYIAHMDSSMGTTASIAGAIVSATLKNNLLSREMAPSLSKVEEQVLRELAAEFGWSKGRGTILAGGSLTNLQALAVARNAKLGTVENGIHGLSGAPVFFASEAAHSSVQKAAMVLGLGTAGAISVKTDADGRMDVRDLRQRIVDARAAGKLPFAIIATVGTTITGAIDPIHEVAEIAEEFQLWLHADAVYTGTAIFSRKHRHRLRGIKRADSVNLNLHKWLYQTQAGSVLLFRDADVLLAHFRIGAPYMSSDQGLNLGEISLHGSRNTYVLGLALTLLHLGRQGLEQLIDEGYALTEDFVNELRKREFIEIAGAADTNMVCFRLRFPGVDDPTLDDLNLRLQGHLLRNGGFALAFTPYRGVKWVRPVFQNVHFTEADLKELLAEIDRFAEAHSPARERLTVSRP
jgi:glutamate/tyrosine decarboxylase-like PLP-dependent enzyme